jgi:hypothetical protein
VYAKHLQRALASGKHYGPQIGGLALVTAAVRVILDSYSSLAGVLMYIG